MGTRNLTVVYLGGTHRVAQYGQWDGDPEGQGTTALLFCREQLDTPAGRARFAEALGRVRFGSDEELKGMSQDRGWETRHPHLARDMAAAILPYILGARSVACLGPIASDDGLILSDAIGFAGDSLFCEWAYVIDLDAEVFEVYRGFNTTALDPAVDRFALREPGEDPLATNAVAAMGAREYQPVRLAAAWSLHDLPLQDEWAATWRDPEDEDEDEEGTE